MGKLKEALFYTSLSEKRMIAKDLIKQRIGMNHTTADSGEQLIDDSMLMDDFELLFTRKIVVCCADDSGRIVNDIIKKLEGADIYAFCEKYTDHWKRINGSESFLGKPVISLSECEELSKTNEIMVILATNAEKREEYFRTIKNDYKGLCPIVTWIGFLVAVFYHIEDRRFDNRFREDFKWNNAVKTEKTTLDYYFKTTDVMTKDDFYMVYSPPKTGSTSVYQSLKARGINALEIHLLSGYDKNSLGYTDILRDFFAYWKETIPEKKSIKVITIVRDPIARSISHAFQMVEVDHIKIKEPGKNIIDDAYKRLGEDIASDDGYIFEWLKRELGGTFGIDIFDYTFDKEKGYMLIEKNNLKFLVMTLEKLNSNMKVIGDFCGLSDFRLKRSNDGQSKWYNYLYRSSLKKITVPDKIKDFYYENNNSMKFFYGDEDIKRFRKKWDR